MVGATRGVARPAELNRLLFGDTSIRHLVSISAGVDQGRNGLIADLPNPYKKRLELTPCHAVAGLEERKCSLEML